MGGKYKSLVWRRKHFLHYCIYSACKPGYHLTEGIIVILSSRFFFKFGVMILVHNRFWPWNSACSCSSDTRFMYRNNKRRFLWDKAKHDLLLIVVLKLLSYKGKVQKLSSQISSLGVQCCIPIYLEVRIIELHLERKGIGPNCKDITWGFKLYIATHFWL